MLNGDKWDIGLGYKEHSLQVANQQMLYLVKTCLNPNKPIFSQKLLNIFAHNLEDLRQTILYYTKYTQSNSRAFFCVNEDNITAILLSFAE